MNYDRLLKLYDDYLPSVLNKFKDYYLELIKERKKEIEANHIADAADELRLRYMQDSFYADEHSKNLKTEHIRAADEDYMAYNDILDAVASKFKDKLSEQEIKKIKSMYNKYMFIDDNYSGDDNEDYESDYLRHALKEALKSRNLKQWDNELPEYLYRGIGGSVFDHDGEDYVERGFFGADEKYPHEDDASKSGKVLFVTTEPSVAASYARIDKFDRYGIQPSNYGDTIYKIRTQGLDPKLFIKDRSATADEVLYGPQYKYLAPIRQEDIEITDSAGNTRTVPRIEKEHYLSDALTKDIYFPQHLIDAVRRKM